LETVQFDPFPSPVPAMGQNYISLDAANQHSRATDSSIGFGGSQMVSSQQYLAPQVHMDIAFHTASLLKEHRQRSNV
jgi:hypothetical protein